MPFRGTVAQLCEHGVRDRLLGFLDQQIQVTHHPGAELPLRRGEDDYRPFQQDRLNAGPVQGGNRLEQLSAQEEIALPVAVVNECEVVAGVGRQAQ